jgi:hypothetical protein
LRIKLKDSRFRRVSATSLAFFSEDVFKFRRMRSRFTLLFFDPDSICH